MNYLNMSIKKMLDVDVTFVDSKRIDGGSSKI